MPRSRARHGIAASLLGLAVCLALPVAAVAAPGGALSGTPVTCQEFRTGSSLDVYAERVTQLGAVHAGWNPDTTQLCLGTGHEYSFSAASDGAGGAIVVWAQSGSSGTDLFAQRLTASGEVATGWPGRGLPLCTAANDQYLPRVVSDGAGGVLVAWQDYRNGRGAVYALRLTGGGGIAPGWGASGLAVATSALAQAGATIAGDGAGGAFVAWQEAEAQGSVVRLQHLTAAGAPQSGFGPAGIPVASALGPQNGPVVLGDGSGGAIVVWEEARGGAPRRLDGLRVTAQGTPATGWPAAGVPLASASAGEQRFVALIGDGAGGCYAAWYDTRDGAGDIYAQRLGGLGTVSAGWPSAGVAVCAAADEQFAPALLNDGAAGAYVAWEDFRNVDGDIYLARLTPLGVLAPGFTAGGTAVCNSGEQQNAPSLAPDGAGGAIATWRDERSAGVAQFQGARNRPATQLPQLESVTADPEKVRLVWKVPPGTHLTAALYRRAEGGEWSEVASLEASATGHLRYEDRSVTAGDRYRYRLGLRHEEATELLAEASVEVPVPRALALHGTRPSPARGVLHVVLSLPTGGPATLELFDVTGRRVASRSLALQPGRHVVDLGVGQRIAPGVYLLRLTQGDQTRTGTATMIR